MYQRGGVCSGDNTMVVDHEDIMICFNYIDFCIWTNLPLVLQSLDIESVDSTHMVRYS